MQDDIGTLIRCYGYTKDNTQTEPVSLKEVTFAVDAKALRELIQFFEDVADKMECAGVKFGHQHFRDFSSHWTSDSSDVIITYLESRTSTDSD